MLTIFWHSLELTAIAIFYTAKQLNLQLYFKKTSNFLRLQEDFEGLNHVNIFNIFVYLLKIFEKRTRGNAAKLTKMSTDKFKTSTCQSLGQYQGPQEKKSLLNMSLNPKSDLALIKHNRWNKMLLIYFSSRMTTWKQNEFP